jgi:hypothetical protein
MMNTIWTFEGSSLVAHNAAGVPLQAWPADKAMGPRLANMLNQSPDLSRALLPALGYYDRVRDREIKNTRGVGLITCSPDPIHSNAMVDDAVDRDCRAPHCNCRLA